MAPFAGMSRWANKSPELIVVAESCPGASRGLFAPGERTGRIAASAVAAAGDSVDLFSCGDAGPRTPSPVPVQTVPGS
jgi:hypothetical protein